MLVLTGEQGSAKSTFSKLMRSLVDPYSAPVRSLPRENRDLYIAASSSHVQAFDNVSGLHPAISDTLCCLSTGGGLALRQLYTDQDEVIFEAMRPIILNGITDVVSRPDLADRAIFLVLEPIAEDMRIAERDLWSAFNGKAPYILGALLDALAMGLRNLSKVQLDYKPRMADFAKWITACEPALWEPGTFGTAYAGNRERAVLDVIDNDPVASAVMSMMKKRDGETWAGTATELLDALAAEAGDKVTRTKAWPSTPRALSGRVTRAATFLRKLGIEVSRERVGKDRVRNITISFRADSGCISASASSAPSAATKGAPVPGELQFSEADDRRTVDQVSPKPTDRHNSSKSQPEDEADEADAKISQDLGQGKGDASGWTANI